MKAEDTFGKIDFGLNAPIEMADEQDTSLMRTTPMSARYIQKIQNCMIFIQIFYFRISISVSSLK